jgi:lipoprotein-anchoring transpeptidase ErfK/SrfK
MSRRSIISILVAVMFTTSVGIALAVRSHASDLMLEDSSEDQPSPESLMDAPHVDPKPNPPVALPAPAAPAPAAAPAKVNGLKADGAIGPQTIVALASASTPSLHGGPPDRIEVDLTKQVLYFVQNNQLVRAMPVSSGSGKTYRSPHGGRARANTPVGTFRVYSRVRGVRVSDLGTLVNPLYFYQGYAIHGSHSVPKHPASHGCIRVTMADSLWLFSRAPVGMPVIVYGGNHTFHP